MTRRAPDSAAPTSEVDETMAPGDGEQQSERPKKCPGCAKRLEADAEFCTRCGRTLAVDAPPQAAAVLRLVCDLCGKLLDADAVFCTRCGARLHLPGAGASDSSDGGTPSSDDADAGTSTLPPWARIEAAIRAADDNDAERADALLRSVRVEDLDPARRRLHHWLSACFAYLRGDVGATIVALDAVGSAEPLPRGLRRGGLLGMRAVVRALSDDAEGALADAVSLEESTRTTMDDARGFLARAIVSARRDETQALLALVRGDGARRHGLGAPERSLLDAYVARALAGTSDSRAPADATGPRDWPALVDPEVAPWVPTCSAPRVSLPEPNDAAGDERGGASARRPSRPGQLLARWVLLCGGVLLLWSAGAFIARSWLWLVLGVALVLALFCGVLAVLRTIHLRQWARLQRARLDVVSGRLDDAERAVEGILRQRFRLAEVDASARLLMVNVLLTRGRLQEARAMAEHALRRDFGRAPHVRCELLRLTAVACAGMGDKDASYTALRRMHPRVPSEAAPGEALGRIASTEAELALAARRIPEERRKRTVLLLRNGFRLEPPLAAPLEVVALLLLWEANRLDAVGALWLDAALESPHAGFARTVCGSLVAAYAKRDVPREAVSPGPAQGDAG